VQNVTGGVRIYLSDDPDKSLIDRHRKDDRLRADFPHSGAEQHFYCQEPAAMYVERHVGYEPI
jgi:hypothetical protein